MTTQTRRQEIREVHKDYTWFYPLLAGIAILIIGFLLGAVWFKGTDDGLGYLTNLYTEVISIGVTLVILDRISEYRATQRLKKHLFRQAKSRSNDMAIEALDQIQHEGWWDDLLDYYTSVDEVRRIDLSGVQWSGGVKLQRVNVVDAMLNGANLEGANLGDANFEGATLNGANLHGASVSRANLKRTNLARINLHGAYLGDANLAGANLEFANLEEATLNGANLTGTNLVGANLYEASIILANLAGATLNKTNLAGANLELTDLTGANLWRANLTGTNLVGANLDDVKWERPDSHLTATLPDGTKWTDETDMTRFTDENHSEFWSPNKDNSDSIE